MVRAAAPARNPRLLGLVRQAGCGWRGVGRRIARPGLASSSELSRMWRTSAPPWPPASCSDLGGFACSPPTAGGTPKDAEQGRDRHSASNPRPSQLRSQREVVNAFVPVGGSEPGSAKERGAPKTWQKAKTWCASLLSEQARHQDPDSRLTLARRAHATTPEAYPFFPGTRARTDRASHARALSPLQLKGCDGVEQRVEASA